jgi:hypothetical protein
LWATLLIALFVIGLGAVLAYILWYAKSLDRESEQAYEDD